jgi:hypothetical protein
MDRRVDLNCLYEILDEVRHRIGGFRHLRDCTGKSGWPERGVYFFFEDGEFREDQKTLRAVRVGTQEITASSEPLFGTVYALTEGIPILAAIIAAHFGSALGGQSFADKTE